ncbi:YHS domain-containing (seleno)protein [Falsiroseomonas sp. HC035]|uniref:YHS domain-containing (seleno)protein n=1 Tax=Falsiroseomonas sp. HC035 TaxID=3390999 RepID=UPI003D31ED58
MHRRTLIALAPGFLAPAVMAASASAAPTTRAINHKAGVALDGYDTVAWFAEGRPRRGNPALLAEHAGVAWHFASAANLARFEADPTAHLPRFGGFCAYGVARGYKVDIDPEAWHIHGGSLYLNYDRGVQRQWQRDIPGNIARAEANWPRLAAA